MEKIKKIRVTVEYSVGLGDLSVDKQTYKELNELFENGIVMNLDGATELQYPNAYSWLQDKIKERDCYDWHCEIDQLQPQVSEGKK